MFDVFDVKGLVYIKVDIKRSSKHIKDIKHEKQSGFFDAFLM